MNNMKKRVFDPALYFDALRQLRMIGIAATVVMTIAALLLPVAKLVAVLSEPAGVNIGIESIVYYSANPFIVLSFVVVAPLLTLTAFSFLNKRSGSDFYHAAPNNRLSLFFSLFAAVATWLLIALVVSTLLSVLFWLCTSTWFHLNMVSALVTFFNMLAASLYVAAAVALAMCVTGTTFTNVVVSLLIIFLPRLLVLVFTEILASNMPLVSALDVLPFMSSQYNVVTNLIYGVLLGNGFGDTFTFAKGGLYTLVVGLLFLAAGAVLFVRRRSESAGHAAPNRILQAVYRLACAMVICLIPCAGILSTVLDPGNRFYSSDIFFIVVLYIIAVLVYFGYELITTRKWKRLLQAVPALGILALLNLGFIGGVYGAYQGILNTRPTAEEIRSVRLVSNRVDKYYYQETYFDVGTEKIRLEDETVRQIAADRLAASIDMVKRGTYYGNNFQRVSMAIELKGRTIYRNVLMPEKNMTELTRQLGKDTDFRDLYMKLPAPGEKDTTVSVTGIEDQKTAEQIYNTLREEIQTLGFEKWYTFVSQKNGNRYYYGSSGELAGNEIPQEYAPYIDVTTSVGSENYNISLPLPTLLPETFNAWLAATHSGETLDKVIAALQAPDNWNDSSVMELCLAEMKDGERQVEQQYYISAMLNDPLRQLLAEIAEAIEENRGVADIRKDRLLIVHYREVLSKHHVDSNGYEYDEYISEKDHTLYVTLPEGVLADGLSVNTAVNDYTNGSGTSATALAGAA